MPDLTPPVRPRVVLVFGDAAPARHLRDALADHVEIVYDTAAADFNGARLAEVRASIALVNLDGRDWLDGITAQLRSAGLAVVFNDPEISGELEGWARARWVRHLVAKLSGSTDYDPPRPVAASVAHARVVTVAHPSVRPHGAASTLATAAEETMTMEHKHMPDAGDRTVAVPAGVSRPNPAVQEIGSAAVTEGPPRVAAPEVAVAEPLTESDGAVSAGTAALGPSADAAGAAGNGLDVDTEALSRLIDQRLAEMGIQGDSEHAVVMQVTDAAADRPEPAGASAPDVAADSATGPVPPPGEAADVVNAADPLRKAGDWQLVDPEAPVVAPAVARAEPVALEATELGDLARVGLVPMELVSPVVHHVDPVEHWIHVEKPRAHSAKRRSKSGNGSGDGDAA